jgi:hypothetical protein
LKYGFGAVNNAFKFNSLTNECSAAFGMQGYKRIGCCAFRENDLIQPPGISTLAYVAVFGVNPGNGLQTVGDWESAELPTNLAGYFSLFHASNVKSQFVIP